MTDPEHALEHARAAAASMRAGGAYEDDTARHDPDAAQAITIDKLAQWALIEPDLSEVRSTRRFGAPVTSLKRALLRLLAQYHAEVLSQQTRFNVYVVGELRSLEQRVERLEQRLEQRVERLEAQRSVDQPPR
jgi:hypothetical protein